MKKILLLLLLLPLSLFSQKIHSKDKEKEEEDPYPKMDFGINIGTYFANKYSANYYSGSPDNTNKLSVVFDNPYIREEIRQQLDVSYFVLREYPMDMHYSVAMTGGLFFKVNVTRNNGIFLEGDYTKLHADDIFTIEVPQNPPLDQIMKFGIHGTEERVNVNLGYHRKFPVYPKKMNIFAQGGLNINYVKVLENFITIYDREYSIMNYDPYSQVIQETGTLQGGIGFGFIAGGGVGFTFTDLFGVEIGGKMIYANTNLEGYNAMRPSGVVYVRFILSGLIQNTEEE